MTLQEGLALAGRPVDCSDGVALSHLRALARVDGLLSDLGRRAHGGSDSVIAALAEIGLCTVGALRDGERFRFPGYKDVYVYAYNGTHLGILADQRHQFDGRSVVERIDA